MMMTPNTGRARFQDGPPDGPAEPASGETVVGSYPPGEYRLITLGDGTVNLLRRDPAAATGDARGVARDPAAINARNAAFWARPVGRK